MVWLIYDLEFDRELNQFQLSMWRTVYTLFKPSLDQITTPNPGDEMVFIEHLQGKLDEKLDNESNPPDAPTLNELR
jgi:hypothetical protein